jgi:hypothetical protein
MNLIQIDAFMVALFSGERPNSIAWNDQKLFKKMVVGIFKKTDIRKVAEIL